MSGRSFSLSMSIFQMANVVLADLATEGYWGYTLTTKPNSLPDQYFKVIAMRKANNGDDYHFMRPFSVSVNEWSHKPGGHCLLSGNILLRDKRFGRMKVR